MSARLRAVIAAHFDPRDGSPYWLARARELGIDALDCVREVDDLALFGPFDLTALSRHPIEHFMPRHVLAQPWLVLAETGGTSGEPRPIAWSADDFEAAFIAPFLRRVADFAFDGGHWLWLGPGGPHVIGKAAQRIAQLTTGGDAFSVDFDPRWFRQLAPASLARARYLEHVLAQALRVLMLQDVRYLFATPVVLTALATRLTATVRMRVRFIYLGGMPLAAESMRAIGTAFPAARCLAGYGNTLFGVTHEALAGPASAAPPRYLPDSDRLIVRVVPLDGASAVARLSARAEPGARGQVVMHRLDPSAFLPCVMERDAAVRVPLTSDQDGIEDPRPIDHPDFKIDNGIY